MENQPQTVDAAAHQAIIAELVDQRDKALAEAANKGAENRLMKAQMQREQEAQAAADTPPAKDEKVKK
jgi:hypothetical protein|tara:strand:- start:181 stop:384 length:204 start_codon:yes stop_codon:yes gene_type:complete